MSKKLIFPKRVKTVLMLVLTCLIAITLTGCDRSNRVSTGNLPLDAEYASAANNTVTVGELYEELRYYASDYVIDETFNFVYKAEIDQVKANTKKYEEKFNEIILTEIYGTDDAEEIAEMKEDNAKDVEIKVNKYIDAMYQKGYTLTAAQVEAKDFSTVYSNYYLEVAKYAAAWNKLSESFTVNGDTIDFGEITDESKITTTEVVNWYTANYTNQNAVDAVLIRFINSTEASNLLKKFGIKTENGRWYQIKLDEEKCATKNGYDEFYDDYDVDKSEDGVTPIEQLGKGKATILKIFAAMYNYIYPYRAQITGFTNVNLETIKAGLKDSEQHLAYYKYIEAIIEEDHNSTATADALLAELKTTLLAYDEAATENEYIHMSKDRLEGYSSTLATYLYNTLKTEAEEEGKTFTQFTTSAKSYNNYYYLLFKLGQEEDVKLYEEVQNEDGTTTYNFLDTTEAKELKQTILEEIFENKLDETFIHEIEHERLEDVKIKIFDSVVESQFMYLSNSELVENYDKTRKSNNNNIASVKYQDETLEITVSDAYAYLEPLYGPQTAASLLFDKHIVNTSYYKDLNTEEQYDEYVETIETMLYYFANDYYAGSGYPSTIGKYNFMKLYFRTSVVEEAVKNVLMLTDAKSAFISDFAAHGFANDSFYTSLLGYANTDRTEYYSLTATSLKVSIDKDEDGKADELAGQDLENAKELLNAARKEIANSSESFANALNTVVSNFNASSRIVENELNPTTPEAKWAKYRETGLKLEVVSIGEINKTTKNADEAVSSRIEELFPTLVDTKLGFTSAYLDTEILNTEDSVSLLLITSGSLPVSAKYENEEKEDLYKDITVVINDKLQKFENLDYTADEITLEQVKIYVAEYVMLGDVYSLPTSTTTALDTYLLPLISKYTSSASQMLIIDNAIGAISFKDNTAKVASTFNEAFISSYSRSNFYENFKQINIKTADSYEETTYADWWTNMYKGGNN